MTTEARYQDLLNKIPGGEYYSALGIILPFRSSETSFRLITNFPDSRFIVLVNETLNQFITTDSNGNALVDILLPLGDIIIEFQKEGSLEKLIAYVTTKNFAVWYASIAEQLEGIDNSIADTLSAYRLAEAGPTDLNLAHGVRLLTPNEFGADNNTYRNMLDIVKQSFRQFGGRLSGKRGIVASITQVNPLIFDRTKNGPRWILGFDLLPNGDLQEAIRPLDISDLLSEINQSGNFITNIEADSYVNKGTGILHYHTGFQVFTWTSPQASSLGIESETLRFEQTLVDINTSSVEIRSGRPLAFIDSKHEPLSFTGFTTGQFLYLNIDDRGPFMVDLSDFGTLAKHHIINGYLHASDLYEQSRKASQFAGSFVNVYEIIFVSDNTPVGSGSVLVDVSTIASYASPGDPPGVGISLIGRTGDVVRLTSNNGIDFIDLFVAQFTLSNTNNLFTISERYTTPASSIAAGDQTRITSQNVHVTDGRSRIEVLDGPGNAGKGFFDLYRISDIITTNADKDDTSITVTAGTAAKMAGNSENIPFKAIVGYGQYGASPVTYDLTVQADPTTAIIENGVGIILRDGATHIIVDRLGTNIDSVNNGVHKILSFIAGNKALISYGGFNVQEETSGITGVKFIGSGPTKFIGSSSVTFAFATTSLTYRGGTPVVVSADGHYRLFGASVGDGYVDIIVESSALPGSDQIRSITTQRQFTSIVSGSNSEIVAWSLGEVVTVTQVTPSGGDEIWTLDSGLFGSYFSGQGIVLPAEGQPPLAIEKTETFGDLIGDISFADAPPVGASGIKYSDNIIAGEPDLPVGWVDKSAVDIDYFLTPEAKFAKGALLVDNAANEVIFEKDVPFEDDQKGFVFTFKTWIRNISQTDGHVLEFQLGFDFGAGFVESSAITINDPDDTISTPQLIEFSQVLPVDATQLRVRIKRTTGGSGADDLILERAVLIQENFSSLFLGDGTIPRSLGRSLFGSLFYVWSVEELSTEENTVIGIDAPSTSGLIRESHNAHEQIDAFDVTDILSNVVTNVRGIFNRADWFGVSLTNLEVVEGVPDKFSYVRPINISLILDEALTFTTISPFTAVLAFDSDQDQTSAILYEDDIPVPNDQWQFNDVTEVEVISGFNSSAIYTIEYNRLTRIEITPIDIVVPTNNEHDTWFVDYVAWNRGTSGLNVLREAISILFDANFIASLPRRSDLNKFASVLVEDNGITRRTIPQSAWEYINSSQVRIDGNEFNVDSIYTFEYNQQLVDPSRAVTITPEMRSAATQFGLSSVSYNSFNINDAIDSSLRFHQVRMTFSNIIDVRDLKVYSIVLKGLNMTGTGSPPPGF